eukprot:CAMPEP_0117474782 /NCGR_PEP_ID=MMETSP0784-20121206/9459_1 /TAXON_ID=39447 /ORGANISM="" /LENGTH=581 /DNA_ID=CAMNT_0005269013 /DNA_START=57 /DNA_END=1799 /DNA_ORIENTATION=+
MAGQATTSIIAGVQDYILMMVEKASGFKVLILDDQTKGIISMVYSMNQILEKGIYRVEHIESTVNMGEPMRHLNAICFLRPTTKNFLLLSEMLKAPNYNEYHIFFSNVVKAPRIEMLAFCDEMEVVHQVQEFFADTFAINDDLFSLNEESTIRLSDDHLGWSEVEYSVFERIIEGLLSACLSLQMLPVVRYSAAARGASPIAEMVAHKLQTRITEERSVFQKIEKNNRRESQPLVLILDRRNDPVTPLLNQWTYQAMIHELLTINNNVIDLSKVPGNTGDREVVMSTIDDQFFANNVVTLFPELTVSIQQFIQDHLETRSTAKANVNVKDAQDLQRYAGQLYDINREKVTLEKHTTIIHELKRISEANGLVTSGQLEQSLACTSRQEHFSQVMEELQGDKITPMQRLRLVLLYALRYEENKSYIRKMQKVLTSKGIPEKQVKIVDQLLRYSGAHARMGDLFHDKTWSLTTVNAMFQDALNIGDREVVKELTQHKTSLHHILEALMKGRLDENLHPYVDSASVNSREPPSRVIVFVVGGATFEEARDVRAVNMTLGRGKSVVLGGTTIHNSRSFLAEVLSYS